MPLPLLHRLSAFGADIAHYQRAPAPPPTPHDPSGEGPGRTEVAGQQRSPAAGLFHGPRSIAHRAVHGVGACIDRQLVLDPLEREATLARPSGPESGTRFAPADSPWPAPFPPPPPRPVPRLCSAASPVLRSCPTSHGRSSSACVLRLPDTVCFRRQPWDLPVPVQNVSARARGLRPRGVLLQHRPSLQSISPSVLTNAVGTPVLLANFAAEYPARSYLYQRPAYTLADACV